jgi:hypothetical protein
MDLYSRVQGYVAFATELGGESVSGFFDLLRLILWCVKSIHQYLRQEWVMMIF